VTLLERAHAHAVRLGRDRIGGEELLLGILDDGVASALFGALGISHDVLVWQLEKSPATEHAAGVSSGFAVTAEVLDVVQSDIVEMIAGLVTTEGGAARALREHGVTPELVREAHVRLWAPFLDENAVWGGRGPGPERGPAVPPAEIELLTSQIAEHRRRKEAAIDAEDYTQAARVRDEEKRVERARSELIREWAVTVDPVNLAEAVVSLRELVATLRNSRD